ncbi:MAG: hypothetical protein SVR04_10055 [Spirochaetota bacterium]|nr:hypothetical protein [Spirochaetota bacterium]
MSEISAPILSFGLIFIIINYISYRRHLFPAMEDDAHKKFHS